MQRSMRRLKGSQWVGGDAVTYELRH